jgi:lipopolysaccharide/colanic/teichoic acid biosynthesis glycosyltransferase
MKRLSRDLGAVNDRIHFLGYRRDIPELIVASTATVLASSQEGLPRSVMESMSLGVPVIGTDIRGTKDLVAEGDGLLVPLGDVRALANAMDWIVDHPNEAQAMADSARARIATYDLRNVLAIYERLYSEALSLPARVPLKGTRRIQSLLKRAIDVLGATVGLIILSPVLAVAAVLIRMRMGTPVLFRQMRPGIRGELFTIYKFRTMTDAKDHNGENLTDSERISRLGVLIRSTSIDELPQLWNVLRGDMSLVGPRPLMPRYVALYNAFQKRRHEVKPGITGWAQINGRNAISWERKFELDVWYIDNWSIWLDLKLLARTVLEVVRRRGVAQLGPPANFPFRGNSNQSKTS